MRSLLLTLPLLLSCQRQATPEAAASSAPTAEEARAFLAETDATLRRINKAGALAAWAYMTDINDAHAEAMSALSAEHMEIGREITLAAARFREVAGLSDAERRQIEILRQGSTVPPPPEAEQREQLATLLTQMEGLYGAGKHCTGEGDARVCRSLTELEEVLRTQAAAADAPAAWDAQLSAWTGWRTVSPPMRASYAEFVSLGNVGARSLGYDDMGVLWRSGYDMDPTAFDAEVERLWQELKPLYEDLHCHVRAALSARYGADKVPPTGPIPAHVLGNMWAQSWDNLFPLVKPRPDAVPVDLTAALRTAGYDAIRMMEAGEAFFMGLGLRELPDSFWKNSMLVQPEGRDVVCHASAWDLDMEGDVRIKMCTQVNGEDFVTIHHELGHIYYDLYYNPQPAVFQSGANDGFHEGIGDTLTLSITPAYLADIGLPVDPAMDEDALLNRQMQDALAKIAFLPFGRMIDLWRWGVFSGEIAPEDYNAAWWRLREQYQGVAAPVARSEADFDPGAKYHIPGNTPYMRYFLAHVLQFQFHEALCEAAGHDGPLHTCSIAGSQAAGEKLAAMLSMGASQPWPDALEAIAGTREMSVQPLLEYFAPLRAHLAEQNAGRTCGW